MHNKQIHRFIAGVVLLISLAQFLLTAQASVSFWDPGELSAAAYGLLVPHPPGGPLFSLVGHIFYMIPLSGSIGFRMNVVSAVASAFSVLFLYLVAVRLIRAYKGHDSDNIPNAIGTYISAAIGALAFSFCDTFWFNGTESNYFAASTFLFSSIVWLMLIWYEKSDQPHSWKYILMIAYLVGLSAGVHLMSVLAIFTVVLVVVFKRYINDYDHYKKTGYLFLINVGIILLIAIAMWANQTSSTPPSPEEIKDYDFNYKVLAGVITLAYIGIFWKKIVNRNSYYMPIAVAGVALAVVYPGVIKKLPSLLGMLANDNSTTGLIVLILFVTILGGVAYWALKNKKPILAIASAAVILTIVGFTTYTMIIIRANQHPAMNENDPNSFTRLVSYLNREQYGDFPMFKRRWSPEPLHQQTWTDYSSDLDFFWRYQMNHMFNRYVEWNYIGRKSFDQDAGIDWKQLFGIPFIIGLFGLYSHFRKDWKMAAAFLILFIFMGYLTAFYQNQQQMQPRDRDYFYGGAYFVFAVWIALGMRSLLDLVEKKFSQKEKLSPAFAGILLAGVLFVPGRMFQTNYFTHDRSKNWLPWDYAYNLLQSCEKNAILFTNGDNDTFPLWYLQNVEEIRRDVRIVNLSLVNTEWYIKQLKDDTPYGTPKLKISYTDEIIDRLQPIQWQPQTLTLSYPPQTVIEQEAKTFGVLDSSVLSKNGIIFTMPATLHYGDVSAIRVQDIMVKDIIQQNVWQRPIYFAGTCSPDTRIGLDAYLWMEGMAYKLKPFKVPAIEGGIDEKLMNANLLAINVTPSKTPQTGYLFRNLNDPKVFYDENCQRMILNYRLSFIRLAEHIIRVNRDTVQAKKTLEYMEQLIPSEVFPVQETRLASYMMAMFSAVGDMKHYDAYSKNLEKNALNMLDIGQYDPQDPFMAYRTLVEIYDARHDYSSALEILKRAAVQYPNVPELISRIQYYEDKLKGTAER